MLGSVVVVEVEVMGGGRGNPPPRMTRTLIPLQYSPRWCSDGARGMMDFETGGSGIGERRRAGGVGGVRSGWRGRGGDVGVANDKLAVGVEGVWGETRRCLGEKEIGVGVLGKRWGDWEMSWAKCRDGVCGRLGVPLLSATTDAIPWQYSPWWGGDGAYGGKVSEAERSGGGGGKGREGRVVRGSVAEEGEDESGVGGGREGVGVCDAMRRWVGKKGGRM